MVEVNGSSGKAYAGVSDTEIFISVFYVGLQRAEKKKTLIARCRFITPCQKTYYWKGKKDKLLRSRYLSRWNGNWSRPLAFIQIGPPITSSEMTSSEIPAKPTSCLPAIDGSSTAPVGLNSEFISNNVFVLRAKRIT